MESEVSMVTGYWLNGPGFKFWQRKFTLSCQNLSRPWLGPTEPAVQSVRWFFPSGSATVQSTCPLNSI